LPKILLTNDDGIQSPGLLALKKELETLGEILVIAPEKERSGIGKALSSHQIKMSKTKLSDGSEAYAIGGTPADAYLLAKYKILGKPPELLVAGINIGPNLGVDDFFTSGTVGAAIEAAIHGTAAVSVSYCLEKYLEGQDKASLVAPEDLKLAAKIAKEVAKHVLEHGMPPDVDIISINVPEKVKSLKFEVTCLSYKGYKDIYAPRTEGYLIESWILSDYPDDAPGTDLWAAKRKRVSITPVKLKFIHNTEGLEPLLETLKRADLKTL